MTHQTVTQTRLEDKLYEIMKVQMNLQTLETRVNLLSSLPDYYTTAFCICQGQILKILSHCWKT